MEQNELTRAIIGAAIEVHRRLGPGLLESAYRVCLAYELRKRGFQVEEERPVDPPVHGPVQRRGMSHVLEAVIGEGPLILRRP